MKENESKANGQAVKERGILAILSALGERMGFARSSGLQYGGKRDLYLALGYPEKIRFEDYYSMYKRHEVASRIIEIKPKLTWRYKPTITEVGSDNKDTEFEKAWSALAERLKIYYYLRKADILSRIGWYGCIFLGFDDGKEPVHPVDKAGDLLYLSCFHSGAAKINRYVEDTHDPRFGYPELYDINFQLASGKEVKRQVHHSRIIHIAEEAREGEIEGTPELEAVFNRLMDIEKIVGGSGEMFWRGAYPGISFEADKDTQIQDADAIKESIDEYLHDFKRYLTLQGMKANPLSPQVADPKSHFDIQIDSIALKVGIPKRILLGSERGELASSQDERAFLGDMEGRRTDHCEPNILRPLIDRLIKVKVLPEPKEGYSAEWQPLLVKDEKEKADIAQVRTTALTGYANSLDAQQILPASIFLEDIMGFSRDEIQRIDEELGGMLDEERDTEPQP